MIQDIPKLLEYLYEEIRKQTDVAVIGLSGGADSTLVAILCKNALGKENVYGVSMPYDSIDEGTFNARSIKLAENLGIVSYYAPIGKIVDSMKTALELTRVIKGSCENGKKQVIAFPMHNNLSQLNLGNIRSRARMCILYSIAHHLGNSGRARVVGTGNLSEDWIGYDTKFGDSAADFFPIGELFKSEVYQLLDYFKEQDVISEEHIDRIPSAGLWLGQRDQDELGYTYDEMEPAIRLLTRKDQEPLEVKEEFNKVIGFVMDRHNANKHKHEAPPVIPLRKFCELEEYECNCTGLVHDLDCPLHTIPF